MSAAFSAELEAVVVGVTELALVDVVLVVDPEVRGLWDVVARAVTVLMAVFVV